MEKEVFKNILQNDEEVIWSEGVNKKAFILKGTTTGATISLAISLFLGMFISGPIAAIKDASKFSEFLPIVLSISGLFFIISIIIIIINRILNANNTYFAITNKRVIKKSGTFNDNFVHYSLKNVGNVEVVGSIYDSKGENASAKLVIITKDFHTDTNGHRMPRHLLINSLNNAYTAYRLLSEKIEGNNEVLRVKSVN